MKSAYVHKEYYPNNIIKSEVFVNNGKKEGDYKEYDQDGQILVECNYINDRLEGIYKEYVCGEIFGLI